MREVERQEQLHRGSEGSEEHPVAVTDRREKILLHNRSGFSQHQAGTPSGQPFRTAGAVMSR